MWHTSRRGFIALSGMGTVGVLTSRLGRLAAADSPPVRIDMHCHVFNARDVPARKFVSNAFADEPGALGWLIGALAKMDSSGAPTAEKEIKRFHRLMKKTSLPTTSRLADCPENIDDPKVGMLDALSRCRWDNVLVLQRMYKSIDLFVPSFVDLGKGYGRPMSNLKQATELAGLLTKASAGRVHTMVGFDPALQVKWERDAAGRPAGAGGFTEPLETVRSWVDSQGALGVKIYPATGFAPLGNDAYLCPTDEVISEREFAKDNGRGAARFRAESGAKYDVALRKFYGYCQAARVPILTHANDSNYANAKCAHRGIEGLGTAKQWESVLTEFPTLKVCFGHFGGIAERKDDGGYSRSTWTRDFVDLMKRYPNAYADLSSFELVLGDSKDQKEAKAALRDLLSETAISKRVVYGSDWSMLGRHAELPFDKYPELIEEALPDDHRAAVMGLNAVAFLGLTDDAGNGGRIKKFWGANLPAWYARLPGAGASATAR